MITISHQFIYIKDYKELLNIDENKIIIKLLNKTLIITGNHLQIYFYDHFEIRCHGEINEISFRN